MKRYTTSLKLLATFCLAVLFFTDASAQRRNPGRNGGYYGNNRNVYSYNNSFYRRPYTRPYTRPFVSIGIGAPRRYYAPVYRRPSYPFTHWGPSFGFRINVLPFGYSSLYYGGYPYYYNQGIFYRPYAQGGYEVTQAPLGAQVKHLPANAKVTVIDGQKYYQLGGTFYQEEITDKNKLRYRVVGTDGVLNTAAGQIDEVNAVAPATESTSAATATTAAPVAPAPTVQQAAPVVQQPATVTPETGSRLNQLPVNSKAVVIAQQKYFVTPDGVYYKEVINGDAIQYEAIGGDAGQ